MRGCSSSLCWFRWPSSSRPSRACARTRATASRWDGWLNNIAYLAAPLICYLRLKRSTSYRTSWLVLTAGLTLYGLGNIYWTMAIRTLDVEPFPSIADYLWLSFYPFAFASLLLMLRERTERLPLSLWLDGLVGGMAVTSLAAAAVVGDILKDNTGSLAAVVTKTAYPLLDLLLLLVVVAILSLFHWRPPVGLWLFATGLTLFAVADLLYLFAGDNYTSGGINDGVWILATVFMALAPAWKDKPAGVTLPSWAILSIPVVSALSAVTLLVLDHWHRLHPYAIILAASDGGARHGPAHRHLPRGVVAGPQPPARPHRRAHRAGQPPDAVRVRPGPAAGAGSRPHVGAAAARPRPVQGGQRQPRPPGRRHDAASGGAPAQRLPPRRRRSPRPPGW